MTRIQAAVDQFSASSQRLQDENRTILSNLEHLARHMRTLCEQHAIAQKGTDSEPAFLQALAGLGPLDIDCELDEKQDLGIDSAPMYISTASATSPWPSAAGDGSGPPSRCTTPEADSFSLTLRRIEGRPLGLLVHPDVLSNALIVDGVQSGSVADAWNAQNAGGVRELKRGDRLVMVNGVVDAEGMRSEFMHKLLLKLSFERSMPGSSNDDAEGDTIINNSAITCRRYTSDARKMS